MARWSAASALLVALAMLLSGCGSGGGEGSSATDSTASTTSATAEHPPSTSPGQGEFGPVSKPAAPTAGAAHHDPTTAGAASFETKGGDNSIQESGSEASGSELTRAAAALHGYLDARAAGSWAKACTRMAAGLASQLSQLTAGGSGQKTPSCAKLLAALSAGLPPAALHEAAQADVGALRVKGGSAFLLFHGAHHSDYFMPMAKEGGQWKVGALAASALP